MRSQGQVELSTKFNGSTALMGLKHCARNIEDHILVACEPF
jgi:hypothetical protein